VERAANDRVRLVEEELRRTRLEAERYRAGWKRLSCGGGSGSGSGNSGGRRRRRGGDGNATTADDDAESVSGAVGGRGRRRGDDDDDDGGRGRGEENATHAFSSWERGGMMGSLFPPPPIVVNRRPVVATGTRPSIGGGVGGGGRKVTPRSSSDDEGTRKARRDENDDDIGHDGGGTVGSDDDRVVRGRDDDCDDCDDRRIEDGTSTSAPGKRRRGSSRHSTTDDDEYDGGGGGDACIDSPARGAFVAGYDGRGVVGGGNRRRKAPSALVDDEDRVRRRAVATSLLNREGGATLSMFSFATSSNALSFFLPPDASADADSATTNARVADRDIEIDARSSVRSILCHMADDDSSSSSNLSVSGFFHVLVMRFNSLFRLLDVPSPLPIEDGDVVMGERGATASRTPSSYREGAANRMLALVIMDSRMTSVEKSEEGLCSWPCAMYTAVSWGAAFYLLGVMRDVLVLSGDARDDVRLWLHRALVSDDSGDDDYIRCSSSGTEPKCDVGYWGMGAIGRSDRSQDPNRNRAAKCRNKWDPLTMSQPFNLFYAFLLGLMKGNVFEYSSTGKQVSDCTESAHSLCQLIQLKAIDLVSILMSDAPRHDHLEVGDTNRTPFLWSFWFDSLTSPVLTTRQSSDVPLVGLVGDFLSSFEDTDNSRWNLLLGSGRKYSTRLLAFSRMSSEQNKRGAEKQSRASNRQYRADPASQSSKVFIDGTSKVDSHLSILVKEKILRLLSHLVLSSSSINQSLYRIVDEDTKTTLAKRILSAVLDQVDNYIVPCLSSDLSSDNAGAGNVDRCLRLTSCCIHFLLIMSRSTEGIRMLRLQMRLESEEDEPSRWSRSAIGCTTAVLNGVLSYAFQIEDNMDFPQLKCVGFVCSLTSIVDQCIAFFKGLLMFVERQRESSCKSTTTFLVLVSEHRVVFQSCCERILACQSPNKISDPPRLLRFSEGLKSDVRCLFEELVIDAEREDGDP
jgi:hypothetical protein